MCLHFYVIQLANLHTLFLQDSELSADESHGRGRGRVRGIGRGRARGRGKQRGVRGRRGRGGGQRGRGRGQYNSFRRSKRVKMQIIMISHWW